MACEGITIETTDLNEVIEVGVVGPQGPSGAAGVGVPTGGITGYVLAKASTADYDTEWVAQTGGGGNFSSPPPIGDVTPNTGAFTNLSAVTGSITTISAGQLTAVTGNFTTISASGLATLPHIHGSLAGNLYVHVKNTSGGTLAKGTPVYITGNVGGSDRVEVSAADFDDAAKMPAVGLLETELAQNGEGNAVIVGELTNVNTAAYSLNTELYVGNNGTLTATAPVLANQIRQSVGIVSRVQTNTGIIVVNMQGELGTMPNFHAVSHAPASEKAIFKGQLTGMTTDVFIRAVTAGTAGDNIVLNFDGVDSINTVIGAWNAANTSNTAELVSGNGSQVPDNGEQIVLSGGTDGGSDPLPYPEILASPSGVNKFKLGLGGDSPTGRFVGVTTAGDPLIGILAYTDEETYNPTNEVGSSAFGMTLGASATNLFAQYLKDGALEAQYTFPATNGTLVVGSTSTDNAIVRGDSTSNTVQDSALVIDDATTSTQANVAVVNAHSETNSALVLTPKGTGAFIVGPKPDGTSTGGNARGANAVDIQTGDRSGATQVASGSQSVAVGTRCIASGSSAVAIGRASTASGNDSIALRGSASSSQSIAIGASSSATSIVSIAIGNQANCTGQNAVAIGYDPDATAQSAVAIGVVASATAIAATSIIAPASLRAQFATLPFSAVYWSGQTTNNTATILNLDAAATNRFTIAANTALAVDILLVARRSDVADKWLVARRFLGIRRDGSNNTSLIGSVQTLGTDQSAGSPSWTFALTSDDTNEALQLEVTGATGETVQWRATAIYRVV